MNDNILGYKIKYFRKRANISQLELECRINAATGSISKIEKGDTNPTKESLIKIIEALNLNSYEAASLFNIDVVHNLSKILKISNNLYSTKDLDKILQDSVNEIVFELKLLGAWIFILDQNKTTLYSGPFTQTWFTKMVAKIIGDNYFKKYRLSIIKDKDNLLVKSINGQRNEFSIYARDFLYPILSKRIINFLQKISKGTCGLSIPLINDREPLGCILFSKMYGDNFLDEIEILENYTSNVAMAIGHKIK